MRIISNNYVIFALKVLFIGKTAPTQNANTAERKTNVSNYAKRCTFGRRYKF